MMVYILMRGDGNVCCPGQEIVNVYYDQLAAEAEAARLNKPTDPARPWTHGERHTVDTYEVL